MKKIIYITLLCISCFFLMAMNINDTDHYANGVFQGSAQGYNGMITVKVTVSENKIQSIDLIDSPKYEKSEPLKILPKLIIANQTLKDIDLISGATVTSQALIKAVQNALSSASSEDQSPKINDTPPLKVTSRKISLGPQIMVPTMVWMIGSYDTLEKANMMTAAWVGVSCSRPRCVTISLRKATYTYGNIMANQAYTVNIPSKKHLKAVKYFGSVSGRDVDKLAEMGYTAVPGDSVNAPYLKESAISLECKVLHTLEVGLHTMFIGEIRDVKADPSVLDENKRLKAEALQPVFFNPSTGQLYQLGKSLSPAF
ncbi:MAG: flavin reductase [bacterium]